MQQCEALFIVEVVFSVLNLHPQCMTGQSSDAVHFWSGVINDGRCEKCRDFLLRECV